MDLSSFTGEDDRTVPQASSALGVAAEGSALQVKFVSEQQNLNYWRLADQPFDASSIANCFGRAPLLSRRMIKEPID